MKSLFLKVAIAFLTFWVGVVVAGFFKSESGYEMPRYGNCSKARVVAVPPANSMPAAPEEFNYRSSESVGGRPVLVNSSDE
jgi:hypothetical protein